MTRVAGSSRDPRLVTVRRGGSLTDNDHRLLAAWAADCAERVLSIFEAERPEDSRPADAVTAARAWAAGDVTMMQARAASVAAHAAAREADGAACLAARACGHAAATAHMADHELGAAFYALKALSLVAPEAVGAERDWQMAMLPDPVAELVRSDMRQRAAKFQGIFEHVSR